MAKSKLQSITFTDYIEYGADEFGPGEEWKCTRDSVVKNIKKHYPKVAKAEKIRTPDGPGLKIYSDDLDTLKKIWIALSYSDGDAHYDEMVKNGELEDELESTDFYGCLS